MIKDKVAAVEPEKGVLLKTDLQGSISKLEEVWEGHPCCKKATKKNGNGWVLLVVMFFGGIQMEILENVLDETAQFY